MNQLCECGCNEVVPLAKKTDARRGWIKGQPVRFIAGHHARMMMTGGKASSPVPHGTLTPNDIENLRGIDDVDAAEVYDQRMRSLGALARRSFAEMGLICVEVMKRSLWARLSDPQTGVTYHSIESWLMACTGVSRTTAYAAWKAIRELTDVRPADLLEMPRCNIVLLVGLSTAVRRDQHLIEAAKNYSEEDFAALLAERFPDQHVEPRQKTIARQTRTESDAMEACFEVVRWAYDVAARGDVVANLCAYFMDGACEREGYTDNTNAAAFALATGRKA